MELVKNQTQTEMTHVPYRGTGPAVTDLLGGTLDVMFLPIHVALQHVKVGSLKALAISSEKPNPLLPDVPPLRELNMGQLDVEMWYGILAPKGTPQPFIDRLNTELKSILALPDVKAAFETQGMVPAHSTPEQFRALMAKDATRWADSIKAQNITADLKPWMDIAIVGAGIGGLTAAASLLRARAPRARLEQAAQLGEVGAGVQMSANAVKVLDHLGLRATIEPSAVRPKAFEFRRFDSGDLLHRLPLGEQHEQRHGAPYFQIHRSDLHDALQDAVRSIDAGAIVLNAKAVGIDEDANGATVHFEDGASAHAELLVGADGIKSAVRKHVIGDDLPVFTGQVAWRCTVPAVAHLTRAAHRHRVDDLVRAEKPRGDLLLAPRRVAQLRRLCRAARRRRVVDGAGGRGKSSTPTMPAGTRWCAR